MKSLRERYENDPYFHSLVTMFRAELDKGQSTPTEIREAAMLAQYFHELDHPRPIIMSEEMRLEIERRYGDKR